MISINATLVVQLINFLILIWILNRVLFKPTFRILEEREKHISDAKEKLISLRKEAENKIQSFEAQMQTARKAAAEKGDEVKGEAEVQAKEIIDQARNQAQEHVSSVQAEAEEQASKVRESMGEYKDAIVDMVFVKVMGRKVT